MYRCLRPLITLLVVAAMCHSASAQELGFIIWKEKKAVGGITALRRQADSRTIYAVSSYSEMEIIKKQVVRSSLGIEYRKGMPYTCFTSFRINGGLRDSSNMRMGSSGLDCFIYPDDRYRLDKTSAWTTSRMYFEEPLGQRSVFVESELRDCPLRPTKPGEYVLELPGNKSNTYRYVDGMLQEVVVARPLMKLVFRKV
jgi:hypothetical protein